jgi:hypothetical protein
VIVEKPGSSNPFKCGLSDDSITGADRSGPGWFVSKPESITSHALGAFNSAWVQIVYANNSSYLEGTGRLTIFSTPEQANASYQGEYEGLSADGPHHGGPVNVTVGDRAVIVASSINDHEGWNKQLVMQKGSSIVWIALFTTIGPSIEAAQMIELAEIQAAKLP